MAEGNISPKPTESNQVGVRLFQKETNEKHFVSHETKNGYSNRKYS